jgi:hypothetical protein
LINSLLLLKVLLHYFPLLLLLMKNMMKIMLSVPGILIGTVLVLCIPLVAMQFTSSVKWQAGDFLMMGILLAGAGILARSYLLQSDVRKLLAGILAVVALFLLAWVNMAVGLIGSGPHWANLLYVVVLIAVIVGMLMGRSRVRVLAFTMFSACGLLIGIAAIQLLARASHFPDTSITEIIAINSVFLALFFAAGLLFTKVAQSANAPKRGK